MIVAGALGNAIDRVLHGMVIDFVRTLFVDFPLFNVADSCITVGIILFIIYIIIDTRESTKKTLKQSDTAVTSEEQGDG